jgi:hypothetical protein
MATSMGLPPYPIMASKRHYNLSTMNTGFVGIGNMGGMLVRALLRSRTLAVENVWAANRSEGKVQALAAEFPDICVAGTRKLAANCDLIFLCLRAEDTANVLAQMPGTPSGTVAGHDRQPDSTPSSPGSVQLSRHGG